MIARLIFAAVLAVAVATGVSVVLDHVSQAVAAAVPSVGVQQ